MAKRIVVTGGSGKAGRYIIEHCLSQGHQVLNLDLAPLAGDLGANVHTVRCDLTDSGQVYSALCSHFRLTEPFREPVNAPPDAVIHLGGIARNLLVPDVEIFRVNTLGSYNVMEAACRLGVKSIVLASSICVYGVTFAEGDVDFEAFPIEEDSDSAPMDTYALSKLCSEKAARALAARFGVDICALRIGPVIAPHEYQSMFQSYVNEPAKWKVHGWSYVDARDLGKMCLLALNKKGLGFQVFNATNDEITNDYNTESFLTEQCPHTPIKRPLGPREAPVSNSKIKLLLGFKEDYNWQHIYERPGE